MENYKRFIEKNNLVITRHMNPFKEDVEWCVGRIYHDGVVDPMAFGETIDVAMERVVDLIEGRQVE